MPDDENAEALDRMVEETYEACYRWHFARTLCEEPRKGWFSALWNLLRHRPTCWGLHFVHSDNAVVTFKGCPCNTNALIIGNRMEWR